MTNEEKKKKNIKLMTSKTYYEKFPYPSIDKIINNFYFKIDKEFFYLNFHLLRK